ncbi:MAG: S26 family signal peptidase [Sphingomonas sp.]
MSRFFIMMAGYLAIAAIVIPSFVHPAPRLVWNASASVPVGLYAAGPARRLAPGDLVAAHAPAPIARMMAERGYLPLRVPMLKHVAAVAGQRVCRSGLHISIDTALVAEARSHDRDGRELPAWEGCRTLRSGEVFLLNAASADSFDGRYFGPIRARSVIAVLHPLWLPGGGPAPAPAAPARPRSFSQPKNEGDGNDHDR